jgi:hypothetical protein
MDNQIDAATALPCSGSQSGLMLFRPDGRALDLSDIYRGCSVFFLGAGPSLRESDLSVLRARGMLTCAVNNAAAVFRPQLWVSVDDPCNFVDVIWRDPGILKFVPCEHFERSIIVRDRDRTLHVSSERVANMPAVFGFHLNTSFQPEKWLFEDTINWGNDACTPDLDGNTGGRSVMFVALRLLFYLGVRRVYLLGCDFRMTFEGPNYAFEQARSRAAVHNNNCTYRILNRRFQHLKPYFEAAGFEVFNCTAVSHLAAFPYRSLDDALTEATASVPQEILTEGMYDRLQRERDAKRR